MKHPLVTNIQKYSIHDGTGIRTTVFFKGCPLACQWCHNPETQLYTPTVLTYLDRCTGCGACAAVCPQKAVHIVSRSEVQESLQIEPPAEELPCKELQAEDHLQRTQMAETVQPPCKEPIETVQHSGAESEENVKPPCMEPAAGTQKKTETSPEKQLSAACAVTDYKRCTGCGTCVDECLQDAREQCGRYWEIRELVEEILKDRAFYETSGGGVTLSGGEVMAQDMDYIEKLVKILKARGIRIFIDTCGEASFAHFERILPYVDNFLFDVKILEEEKHRRYTGVGNHQILDNLKQLSQRGASIWIRIPVIGGVNDSEEEIASIGRFLRKNQIQYQQINLLPYHNTGSGKYQHLNRAYQGARFYVPEPEKMEALKAAMEQEGAGPVFIGG